jgi:hypothetical protein
VDDLKGKAKNGVIGDFLSELAISLDFFLSYLSSYTRHESPQPPSLKIAREKA